ncbi:MAG: hypothetical protein JKY03_00560 [Aureispira sp.]|nr:hypothetical protein [Aureispira sp.]
MINSKLIQLYSALNKEEKTLFKKWVHSPVHNQHKDVIQLFDFIAGKRNLTACVLTKKKAFAAIYSKKKYNDLRLRHLMTLGVGLLEDFVCFFMQKRNEILQQKHLIDFYEERNLNKLLRHQFKKTTNIQTEQSLRDQGYYYSCYKLQLKKFYFFTRKDRIGAHNIPTLLETHSILMVIEVLANACVAANSYHIDQRNKYKILFLDEVLEAVEEGKYRDVVAIQFYFNAYKCAIFETDTSYFYVLNQLLLEEQHKMERVLILNLYHIAINYCIRKINRESNVNFLNELFALYQLGIKDDLLLEYGVLDRFSYKNIIALGLTLKRVDWVAEFIEERTPLVEKEHRENYRLFAQVSLAYTKEEYQHALTLLGQTELDDLFLNIAIKNIQIKVYYEMGLFDLLDSFLKNCAGYLQRNAKMIHQYEAYSNFVKLTRRLLYLKPYDTKALNKLKIEVNENNLSISREWLAKQVNKLSKNG